MFNNRALILQAFQELNGVIVLVCEGKLSKVAAFERMAAIIENDDLARALGPRDLGIVPTWPRNS